MDEVTSKNIGGLVARFFTLLIKFLFQPFVVIWYILSFQADNFCRATYKLFVYLLAMAICVFETVCQIGMLLIGGFRNEND